MEWEKKGEEKQEKTKILWKNTLPAHFRVLSYRFLGLDLDTIKQLILIPKHKVKTLLAKIRHILLAKSVKVKTFTECGGIHELLLQGKAWQENFHQENL